MKCPDEMIELMHDFLDEDISPEKEKDLREHLQTCKECETIFVELNKTIALVKSTSNIKAPDDFAAKVMAALPKEKRKVGFERWLKNHPLLAAASLFIILMVGSLITTWNQGNDFSFTSKKNLVVRNNTVIIPEGKTVKGDIIVRNGNLRIEGELEGDATVINGEKYMASAGHVTGQIEEINQVFDWIWYQMKKTAHDVVDIFNEPEPNRK